LIDLALLVRGLSSVGDAERRLCREVLEAFVRYSENAGEPDLSSL
jgi:hypothetical protein